MNDDFGTPEACAVLFEMVREINRLRESDPGAAGLAARLKELASVLGVLQLEADDFLAGRRAEGRVEGEVDALIAARAAARAERKDWAESTGFVIS